MFGFGALLGAAACIAAAGPNGVPAALLVARLLSGPVPAAALADDDLGGGPPVADADVAGFCVLPRSRRWRSRRSLHGLGVSFLVWGRWQKSQAAPFEQPMPARWKTQGLQRLWPWDAEPTDGRSASSCAEASAPPSEQLAELLGSQSVWCPDDGSSAM